MRAVRDFVLTQITAHRKKTTPQKIRLAFVRALHARSRALTAVITAMKPVLFVFRKTVNRCDGSSRVLGSRKKRWKTTNEKPASVNQTRICIVAVSPLATTASKIE